MEKVITAIQIQKRDPKRVNIELDGEFAFGLSRIVGAWLKVGEHLSDEKIALLQQQDLVEKAYQKALNLLGYRPRTEKEIVQKLSEKEFTTEQIEQTVETLRNAGLVQDADFARAWVENRNTLHPRSRRLISYELARKGIAEDLIQTALKGSAEDAELALRAAKYYARRLIGSDRLTFRKKLSAFLARRGFNYETISPIVNVVWENTNLDDNESGKNEEY